MGRQLSIRERPFIYHSTQESGINFLKICNLSKIRIIIIILFLRSQQGCRINISKMKFGTDEWWLDSLVFAAFYQPAERRRLMQFLVQTVGQTRAISWSIFLHTTARIGITSNPTIAYQIQLWSPIGEGWQKALCRDVGTPEEVNFG